MSYTITCDRCDTRGIVSQDEEEIVTGQKMYRTLTDEYESWSIQDMRGNTGTPADEAPIPKWNHYCHDHAMELGIL